MSRWSLRLREIHSDTQDEADWRGPAPQMSAPVSALSRLDGPIAGVLRL